MRFIFGDDSNFDHFLALWSVFDSLARPFFLTYFFFNSFLVFFDFDIFFLIKENYFWILGFHFDFPSS